MKLFSAEWCIYLWIPIEKEVLSRYETKQTAINKFLGKGRTSLYFSFQTP